MERQRDDDDPLTPVGSMFVTPELNRIIECAVGFRDPIDVEAFKSHIRNSVMIQLPRLSSLLVTDTHGRDCWRKTQVDVDRHVIVIEEHVGGDNDSNDDEDAVNDYLADLAVSRQLSTEKPLWEIHLLMAHKCAVFRFHHSVMDGTSMMSLLSAIFSGRRTTDADQQHRNNVPVGSAAQLMSSTRPKSSSSSARQENWLWRMIKMVWFTIIYSIEQTLRSQPLWVRDDRTSLRLGDGDGLELWPKKTATARFKMDDFNLVRSVILNATINDVFLGVLSSGISRYLDMRWPNGSKSHPRITGLSMVNARRQRGPLEVSEMMKNDAWGNKFSVNVVPICYCKDGANPLDYVKSAKQIMDKKKLSYEGLLSYEVSKFLISCFGNKYGALLTYKLECNGTFVVSNMMGPQAEVTMAQNPVRYIRSHVSSMPLPITFHMVSYAGMADLQITVAKDIIPDPKAIAKCFEDAFLQMKKAAEEVATQT